MYPSEGFQTALNEIRETLISDNKLYQQQLPVVDVTTSSQVYGQSLLSLPADLRNKFINALVDRIAYTAFTIRYFNNPFESLKGDETPLGAIGQEVYINPAKGRVYNIDDFAGLLAKYESDVKAEYNEINADFQYPATIVRQELQKAFVSWGDFERLIMGISASLYNGSYIDQWKLTKLLVSNAYRTNSVQMETVSFVNSSAPTKDELEAITVKLRELYLNFQEPSDKYNAWKKVGGYGHAIETWTPAEDIVVFINTKMASWLDVKVLANAFNITEASLMGRVFTTSNFDVYDNDGVKVFDGSNIVAQICDKRWFKIRDIDMFMDEFYNANNRSWQKYLNYRGAYNFSLFANAVQLVTAVPSISATAIQFEKSSETLTMGTPKVLEIVTTPVGATETITFTADDSETYVTLEKIDNRHVKVTPVSATGSAVTITATGGTSGVTGTCSVEVNDILVSSMSFKYSTRSITGTGKVSNELTLDPTNASETINFTSSDNDSTYVSIEKKSNTKVEVTGVSNTSDPVIITATGATSGKTATFSVTVSGNA